MLIFLFWLKNIYDNFEYSQAGDAVMQEIIKDVGKTKAENDESFESVLETLRRWCPVPSMMSDFLEKYKAMVLCSNIPNKVWDK